VGGMGVEVEHQRRNKKIISGGIENQREGGGGSSSTIVRSSSTVVKRSNAAVVGSRDGHEEDGTAATLATNPTRKDRIVGSSAITLTTRKKMDLLRKDIKIL